jgi:hypothetical protein
MFIIWLSDDSGIRPLAEQLLKADFNRAQTENAQREIPVYQPANWEIYHKRGNLAQAQAQ